MADLARMQGCLLELSVLNLLDEEGMQGYDVAKRLAEFPRLTFKAEAVFELLDWLCREGIVTSTQAADRGRRVYELTQTGRQQLWSLNDAWQEVSGSLSRLTARDRTYG
jgi:DNA-binding PadR family transcriptional regulator